ncbi:PAS domain S-box protein [Mariniphaga sediminis]|uniref:protein-glutamate O-methyltransferase n=1 Tax=Mariniphaga sediminis TaxID=1628158 RepID=A0A399CW11_9BACT|nr:chemotaxis protein CheB [Mariniphaga sediminis]RIH63416.1 PAS domain S-box protein [Mariniphaga sediminis]
MKRKKTKPTDSPKEKSSGVKAQKIPIVGIGASAGGLEALEQFLKNVPDKSGMAYVVVQHLDPTQKGMLPELLQRVSNMKVFQVEDLMKVKPNCVYVIPPNKSMSIFKGALHLFDPVEARGLRLPVDFFLRSLADDQKENAVGIVLSGMGSDGSIGIRAIKEKNGIALVQEPDTAKFDSMPRNAIDSGLIDIVAPPEKLPSELIHFLKHIPVVKSNLNSEVKDKSALEKIIILLRTHTGNDFSLYKRNTVYRRIERRMSVHKIDGIFSYVHFLQENPKEVHILFKELMIGVTNFFRDAPVWEKLKEKVLPGLIDKLKHNSQLRAWVPGCSTGEEAYSLAIVFKETLEKVNPNAGISLQIFASDLDSDAIDTARKGLFPENITNDVSAKRLSRFFTKVDDMYRINTEIREMVVFAHHNIIMHPPFTNLDIISCRNLLIYMDPELQRKLLGLFYYSLNQQGFLMLGTSETLGVQSHLFEQVDSPLKIFKRSDANLNPQLFDFPSSFTRTKTGNIENTESDKPIMNIQTLADQLLLQQFSPAGVLVNENGDILYISGRTGKYLEPAVGKANLNIFAMLRPGFQNDFAIAFRKAVMNKEATALHHVKIGTNGGTITLNVNIQWIHKPEPLYGKLMIIFTDIPQAAETKQPEKKGKKAVASVRETELEHELQHTREEMQNILEEMQTSQEELKSTNEELQSTNEELQSTNEELTTSKEEMQSLNEELQTVNAELMAKVEDYSRVNNDMKNLLNSTDIATLFLDKELNIRRYTNQATKIFKLIKSDIGRPFTDQVSQLIYPDLPEDAREVLRTLIFIEKQIPTKDGRWFSIRIMPYRTFDDRIDGLVITFINISELKLVEEKLNENHQFNRLLLHSSSDVIIKLSPDWKILEFNSAAEDVFGVIQDDVINKNYLELFVTEPMRHKTEQQMNQLLKHAGENKIKMRAIGAGGLEMEIEWKVNVLSNDQDLPMGVIITTKKLKS